MGDGLERTQNSPKHGFVGLLRELGSSFQIRNSQEGRKVQENDAARTLSKDSPSSSSSSISSSRPAAVLGRRSQVCSRNCRLKNSFRMKYLAIQCVKRLFCSLNKF